MRTAIRARYVATPGRESHEILRDVTVVVEGNTIVGITHEEVTRADDIIHVEEGIVVPGFVNLHNHALNGPTLKGIVDDYDRTGTSGSLIYNLLMPLGDLSTHGTSEEDIRAIYRLALLEIIKSGTTTMLDMWRPAHRGFLDVSKELGMRAYGAPYVISTPPTGVDANGIPTYATTDESLEMMHFQSIFDEYDEGASGRIRVVLGPHGTDTCSPELLRAVRRKADELDTLITIHAAQSRVEATKIQERYGLSPIEYLQSTGIVGPDVIAAHCIFADDNDMAILRDSGTSVAICPMTFARGGITAPFERFASRGIRTGIGTDGYGFDYIEELRAAGIVSKLRVQQSHVATAGELLKAGTEVGAAALGRSDLGRIEVGAKADLAVIDLGRAGLQPVRNPVKSLIWYSSATDVSAVMIDGQTRVRDGKAVGVDENSIITAGVHAMGRLWDRAEAAGIQLDTHAVTR